MIKDNYSFEEFEEEVEDEEQLALELQEHLDKFCNKKGLSQNQMFSLLATVYAQQFHDLDISIVEIERNYNLYIFGNVHSIIFRLEEIGLIDEQQEIQAIIH